MAANVAYSIADYPRKLGSNSNSGESELREYMFNFGGLADSFTYYLELMMLGTQRVKGGLQQTPVRN